MLGPSTLSNIDLSAPVQLLGSAIPVICSAAIALRFIVAERPYQKPAVEAPLVG
jgi:hypothetical protein